MSANIMIPRDHAHDALRDSVDDFYNYMVRLGIKELSAREWMRELHLWLTAYDLQRRYDEALKQSEERP